MRLSVADPNQDPSGSDHRFEHKIVIKMLKKVKNLGWCMKTFFIKGVI